MRYVKIGSSSNTYQWHIFRGKRAIKLNSGQKEGILNPGDKFAIKKGISRPSMTTFHVKLNIPGIKNVVFFLDENPGKSLIKRSNKCKPPTK